MDNQVTMFEQGFVSGYPVGFQAGFCQGLLNGKAAQREYLESNSLSLPDLAEEPLEIAIQKPCCVDVVISACNEARTIQSVIRQVKRIVNIRKVFVVVNGSTDRTGELAHQAGALVIEYEERLGYDVGRAIGAKYSDADGLLFIDGDIFIDAAALIPFLTAIAEGIDVALNDISTLVTADTLKHSVMTGKYFINLALNRPDLGPNTLTAIPHALSRRAIDLIAPANLAVPPKAHLMAIKANLAVRAVTCIDVISTNRIRPSIHCGPGSDLVEKLILGDHLEALHELFGNKVG